MTNLKSASKIFLGALIAITI